MNLYSDSVEIYWLINKLYISSDYAFSYIYILFSWRQPLNSNTKAILGNCKLFFKFNSSLRDENI